MPDDQYYQSVYPEDVEKAFHAFRKLLSSKKAREALKNAEAALAFDAEIFLKPLRRDLAECFDLIADMIRERGTDGSDLQRMIPTLSDWLDPGREFALDISRLEKTIADKKRKHPDFVFAFKLQILINRYQEQLEDESLDAGERDRISRKLEQMKRTLADHMQKKIRIAQRAFAPDMLEIAQAQLELARKREKILRIKHELLNAAQGHTQHTLENLAKIFQDVEPDLANTILTQTQALITTGSMLTPDRPSIPNNLKEYKEELNQQNKRIREFDDRLKRCFEQLHKLQEFEDAIFNTYGEQLRAKGIQFKKTVKVDKTGIGGAVKKQRASRMVDRRS